MGRIQNRDFDIEAGQLGIFPSRPSSQLGPCLGQLGQVYSACCSIAKGDVEHVLICQNVYVTIQYRLFFLFFFLKFEMFYFQFIK